jgi:hypothetical protein
MPCWCDRRTAGRARVRADSVVFLPDHWHAIFFPASPLTIALVMECIQVSSTSRINAARHEKGKAVATPLFRPGLENGQGVPGEGGLHPSKPRAGRLGETGGRLALVERGGVLRYPAGAGECPPDLRIDRVVLPADEGTPI